VAVGGAERAGLAAGAAGGEGERLGGGDGGLVERGARRFGDGDAVHLARFVDVDGQDDVDATTAGELGRRRRRHEPEQLGRPLQRRRRRRRRLGCGGWRGAATRETLGERGRRTEEDGEGGSA